MPEWTIGAVSKTVVLLWGPRVRIPVFPPHGRSRLDFSRIFDSLINIRTMQLLSAKTKQNIGIAIRLILFLISVVVIGTIVVDYGFELTPHDMLFIDKIYDLAWWIYLVSFSLQLICQWKQISRKTITMTLIMGLMLYLSALPRFITLSENGSILLWLWQFLSDKFYTLALLGLCALLDLSKGIVGFINKKTNPALLMTTCFAIIIAFGTLLLLLPRSTHPHIQLSIVDALFVSTSAVCVTGLTPVDIAQTFSFEGQIIIALLVQIGGLGVMTITSFFALFFMGGAGLYNQFALRDMIGSETFSSLISTLLYILGFTFVIEAGGAFCIWLNIHSSMGMTIHEEIFFALFHSVSAFCNAGFSTLYGNLGNPTILCGHNGFFITISALIVLGGIGFPILMNFKRIIAYHINRLFSPLFHKGKKTVRYMHLTNINTKMVLSTTIILIISGTVLIAILEWNATFADLPVADKITQSLFNAVAPRTAGFCSVDLTRFSFLTTLIYIILMWIGGASQSTAGGIKVNTFAVALANFISVIKGRQAVVLFGREITGDSVRRASAVIFGSILVIIAFFIALVVMEPHLPPLGLLFETVSAFGTVGSSLNITPLLGIDSKILIATLMFTGRVGFITVMMSFIQRTETPKYRFPKGNVIIN